MAETTAILGLALAVWALWRHRRLARRLEQLTQSYWELRYQYGQLRARINHLDHLDSAADDAPATPPPGQTFIPLSSLRR
ncbi:MAG: hypothetical protein HYZ58_11735 [Acidobacteria bacterium]|nr:hypothetical protein [Acidobacteriota bacterium]